MTRRITARMYLFSAALFLGLAPMVQGAVITQRAADNYVAFEAEDYTSMGGTRWRVIDLVNPYTHPDPDPDGVATTPILLPPDTNASGGAALLTDFSESSPSGTGIVVYQLELTTTGTYYYYTRDGAFENGDSLGNYGNEDSHYIPLDFNVDPNTSNLACRYDGYGATEGQYAWRNGGSSRTFSITTPGTYEFRIKNRESGFSLDRIILSTTAGLNASALDALYNHDVVFTYAETDGDWSTAANWDHGVPTASGPAFIGNGRSMTLIAAGAGARKLSIGYDDDLLPGSGTLTQTGGDLTVGESLKIGFLENGPDSITGNYTVTGGGSLQVGLSTTERADLYVGKHTLSSTDLVATGTLDLSGAAQFTAYLDNFEIGNRASGEGDGTAQGIVSLAADNVIDATSILISRSSMWNTVPLSELRLGASNLIKTDTLTVGGLRGNAKVSFLSGGTLTLEGSSGDEADLFISSNIGGTSSPAKGVMDLSGGTFNATLDEVVIGYDDGKAAGVSDGTLTFDAGTVEANSLVIGAALTNSGGDGYANGKLNMNGGTLTVAGPVTLGTGTDDAYGTITLTGGTFSAASLTGDALGTGTVDVKGGAMTIAGNVAVDVLRVGDTSHTGTFTVTGATSTVQVGSAADPTDMVIGHKAGSNSETIGTVDLSAAASLTAHLDNLLLGQTESGATQNGGEGRGTLHGAVTNTIFANTIQLGDTRNGDWDSAGTINLGTTNAVHVDDFYVGRAKSLGTVTIASGGTLTLDGNNGTTADLFIGYNDQATGAVSNGKFNMSGGTLNATLDQLVIGYKSVGGTGGAQGTLTMEAGTLTANSVVLADRQDSSTGTVAGAINLSGGAFAAESVTKGIGTANFNWTGGALHVETFGFDLVQNNTDGLSVLAPGRSLDMTTIQGNYSLLGGQIEIELNSPLDQGDQNPDDEIGYDFVHVEGDALLNGQLNILLADGYEPEMRDSFDVLQVDGEWSGTLLDDPYGNLTGDPLGAYAWWDVQLLDMPGGGHVFRLTVIPEPNSLVLALLGLLVSGCLTCRRPYGVHR